MVARIKNGKREKQVGGPDRAGEEIKRLWGNVPVVDATENLTVIILPEDLAKAIPKSPSCCVFARACERSFGCTKLLFFRTVAYVELPQENGELVVKRFLMSKHMRALIEAFDRGEGVIPKAGFVLLAPIPSQRLDAKRCDDSAKRRARKIRQRERLLGEREGGLGQGMGKYRDEPIIIDQAVRTGSGAVHFTAKKMTKT